MISVIYIILYFIIGTGIAFASETEPDDRDFIVVVLLWPLASLWLLCGILYWVVDWLASIIKKGE